MEEKNDYMDSKFTEFIEKWNELAKQENRHAKINYIIKDFNEYYVKQNTRFNRSFK